MAEDLSSISMLAVLVSIRVLDIDNIVFSDFGDDSC